MTNVSNMGRCDLCGKPIDLEDAEHTLSTWETPEPEHEEMTKQQLANALADALRRHDGPYNQMAADIIEEEHTLYIHESCEEKTALPHLVEVTGGNDYDD